MSVVEVTNAAWVSETRHASRFRTPKTEIFHPPSSVANTTGASGAPRTPGLTAGPGSTLDARAPDGPYGHVSYCFAGTLSDMTTEKVIIGMLWKTGATQREIRDRVEAKLRELPAKYDRLNDVIRDKLDPKAILIPEYPTALFDGKSGRPTDGCGIFEITGPQGVSASDGALIEELGNKLNDVVRDAAARNDWTIAGGIASKFKKHGYCSGQSYFVFAEESCNTQDDLEGTMHPNRTGTASVAKQLQLELTRILNRLDAEALAGVRRIPTRPAVATGGMSPPRPRRRQTRSPRRPARAARG